MIITKGDLLEVSIVLAPAQPDAVFDYIKGKPAETLAEFEKGLIANGWCNSRNQAQKIVEIVKRHVHLLA